MVNTLQHWCLRTVRQGMGGTIGIKGKVRLEALGPDLEHVTRPSSQHVWEFLRSLGSSALGENGKTCSSVFFKKIFMYLFGFIWS